MKKVQSFLTALEKIYLDCSRCMSQPLLLFLRKMGRDCLIYGVMIFIEPCALLFGHPGRIDCIQIPRNQGQDLAWAEAGISTVGQAKERTTTYRRNTFAIMKAFGINDRNPVDPELSYIEKWLNTYDFTLDLVLEACKRTMERLHKPNFEYADRILTRWSDQKVHNMNDVLALDQEHQKKAARRAPASQARSTGFTNFQQRDYDFDELEKQLLESQH